MTEILVLAIALCTIGFSACLVFLFVHFCDRVVIPYLTARIDFGDWCD